VTRAAGTPEVSGPATTQHKEPSVLPGPPQRCRRSIRAFSSLFSPRDRTSLLPREHVAKIASVLGRCYAPWE